MHKGSWHYVVEASQLKEMVRVLREFVLGVIARQVGFERIAGDAGNPESYSFPARIIAVESVKSFVYAKPRDFPAFRQAAKALEEQGVSLITTTCGFLVIFQDQLTRLLKVPVVTSSLIQVPLAYSVSRKRVGIITANSERLGVEHLRAAHAEGIPVAIGGLESQQTFRRSILEGRAELDAAKISQEVVEVAQDVLCQYPDIGSFVLECHNLSPYSNAIREVTGRTVYDIIGLIESVYRSVVGRANTEKGGLVSKREYDT
jgi:hypothetical protein